MNLMDVEAIRKDFPVLSRKFDGKALAYLDNAASTQKPEAVIRAIHEFYAQSYANVHRSVYALGTEATEKFEEARTKIAAFLNASPEETVFTRNTTESINLVAYSWGDANVQKGDALVVTEMDHHSNLVPWQQLAARKKAELVFVPVDENGDLADFDFPDNTKLFAFPQVSNALGTVNDVPHWVKKAKKAGATVLVDGAAGAPHGPLDTQTAGADFYAFSGHKLLGPMGSGVLRGKKEALEAMPPFLYGGSMIASVEKTESVWAELPQKFEAGTPDAGAAVGLAAALEYLEKIGFAGIRNHEEKLDAAGRELLSGIPGVTVYGNPKRRVPYLSFNLEGVHTHDVGSILDSEGVAVRSGHHCAQVLMRKLGVPGTTRASFYLYNTEEEAHRLADGIRKAKKVFA